MQSVPITTDFLSSNLDQGEVVSSTNKTDRHDITEILLKVALNTIKQTSHHILPGDVVVVIVSSDA